MDPGWRETYDESKPRAARVFQSAVAALCAVPQRTFTFADAAFLTDWLRAAGDAAPVPALSSTGCPAHAQHSWRAAITHLTRAGRLELVGGGWVQPDELLAPPDGVLSSFALGLAELTRQLPHAPRPTVAWQIDPFGHGAHTPAALRALNFSAVVLNRVPWRTRQVMRHAAALDFSWAASEQSPSLAAHVLYAHYSAPPGLDFGHADVPLSAESATQRARSTALRAELAARAQASSTGHVLLLVGDDFRFAHAGAALTSLDLILSALSTSSPSVRAFYSTPSAYFAALQAAAESAHVVRRIVRHGAFAPYTDTPLSWENTWAGAYAARPALKAAAWRAAKATHAAGVASAPASQAGLLEAGLAAEQAAILLHHDAVTGTCAPRVAANYMRIAELATSSAQRATVAAATRALACQDESSADAVNESSTSSSFLVAVFNPLGWTVARSLASIPVALPERFPRHALTLTDARNGRAVPCQLDDELSDGGGATQRTLRFVVRDLPPLATRAYRATWAPSYDTEAGPPQCAGARRESVPFGDVVRVGGGSGTGAAAAITRHKDGASLHIALSFPDAAHGEQAVTRELFIQLLNYVFLPHDSDFGTGVYVTRSMLVSGIYLWTGLGSGGATALLFALLAERATKRRRHRPAFRRARICFAQGLACGAALVIMLTQCSLLPDDAVRTMLKNGIHAGAPFGAVAVSAFAVARGAVPAVLFLAGAAAGVPLWLAAAPGQQARRRPLDAEALAPAACERGELHDCCHVPLSGGAQLSVCASAGESNVLLRISAAAEPDTQVVARLTPHGAATHVRSRDDGVSYAPWRFVRHRSVPANAAAVAAPLTLRNGLALLPMQPTAGVPLGRGVELSIARSATSDDGRGLGGGAPGKDGAKASLSLHLTQAVPPATLRGLHRRAYHAPVAVVLPTLSCAHAQAAPRVNEPLPPGVHLSLLRRDEAGSTLRATLHHIGEPGVDTPYDTASLAAALGGETDDGVGKSDAVLVPGAMTHVAWRPAFDVAAATIRAGGV